MNIREMHYDFKQKLNKIDSQQYRNLQVPEIDWKLNEATEMFVKNIAEPRAPNGLGFEVNQRAIEDIRTLVVNQTDSSCTLATKYEDNSYIATLPEDYWFHVSSEVNAKKGKCKEILSTNIRQHDDRFKISPFDKSSFEWREINILFFEDKIRLFTDGTFEVLSICINYIKKPIKIHNAQDFVGGTYKDLGTGLMLTGFQDSDLPTHTHREIVDLAVLVATGELQLPDYQIKHGKIKLTN